MSADILAFTGDTKIQDRPETVLEKAKGWGMERCIVLGWKEDGSFCFGGSFSELGEIVLLLRCGEQHLMSANPNIWSGR